MKLLIALTIAAFVCSAYGASLTKRDLRDDLVQKAVDLESRASSAIKKLHDEGKQLEASVLENEVRFIHDLSARLKTAQVGVAIVVLETELRLIEFRVEQELIRLGPVSTAAPNPTTAAPVVKRDAKSDAVAKAQALEEKIKPEIIKVVDAGNTREANVLKNLEKELLTLTTSLKAATAGAEVTRLETQLKDLEERINAELITCHEYVK